MKNLLRFWLPYYILKIFFLREINIEVKGLGNIPQKQGFIIASNHEHSWDPVLIAFALKRHVHFFSIDSNFTRTLSNKIGLSKLERIIFKDSISGFFLRLTQQIPVSYKNRKINSKAFLKASQYLGKKEIIGIFPEGELKLKKKKIFPGAAILAQRSKTKILPVHISTNAPSDSFIIPNFTKVKISIGKPLEFSKSVNYTKKFAMKEVYRLKK